MACIVNYCHRRCSNGATEVNDILQWIIDHDPSVQRKLVLEKLGKTYADIRKWLFEHETFVSWHEDRTTEGPNSQYGLKLLWMHGPGRDIILNYNTL